MISAVSGLMTLATDREGRQQERRECARGDRRTISAGRNWPTPIGERRDRCANRMMPPIQPGSTCCASSTIAQDQQRAAHQPRRDEELQRIVEVRRAARRRRSRARPRAAAAAASGSVNAISTSAKNSSPDGGRGRGRRWIIVRGWPIGRRRDQARRQTGAPAKPLLQACPSLPGRSRDRSPAGAGGRGAPEREVPTPSGVALVAGLPRRHAAGDGEIAEETLRFARLGGEARGLAGARSSSAGKRQHVRRLVVRRGTAGSGGAWRRR